jgi:hypothetical protein
MSFVTKPKVGPNRQGISIKKFENKQKNSLTGNCKILGDFL